MTTLADERAELRRLLEDTGLTLNGNARFLGIDSRTIRRWVNDGDEPPRSVVMLLALMEHFNADPAMVRTIAGYEE